MRQVDVEEYGNDGVAFDLLTNESVFRIAFCTDLGWYEIICINSLLFLSDSSFI